MQEHNLQQGTDAACMLIGKRHWRTTEEEPFACSAGLWSTGLCFHPYEVILPLARLQALICRMKMGGQPPPAG